MAPAAAAAATTTAAGPGPGSRLAASLSPFEDLLKLGASLGLKPTAPDGDGDGGDGNGVGGRRPRAAATTPTPTAATANLSAIAEAVECCQEAHRARAELLRLRELERLALLTAPQALARREAALGDASSALERVARERLALARRLREARVRPGVPVDPARQPDFSALLRHAAGGATILQHGGRLLRAAVAEMGSGAGEGAAASEVAVGAATGRGSNSNNSNNAKWAAAEAAARWEDGLRPLAEAAAACRERVAALEAFSRAMEGDRDEDATIGGD